MPEPPPPGVAENADVHGPEALTPAAIESVLADFRTWLEQLPPSAALEPSPVDGEAPDLHTLLGQFLALRHEVNLQTRAVRAQQEQNAETLQQLTQALAALQQKQTAAGERNQAAADEQLRPLLKTLVDLYDALALARREMQRVQETVTPSLKQLAAADLAPLQLPALPPVPETPPAPASAPRPSWWARWLGRAEPEQSAAPAAQEAVAALREACARQRQVCEEAWQAQTERAREAGRAAGGCAEFLDSVITGYTMSLQRVERALQQHGLEPIPAVGRPFDPELMEVLEAATGTGRPPGEVLDEIRRGYLWRGRVFRYAQVRVAKS